MEFLHNFEANNISLCITKLISITLTLFMLYFLFETFEFVDRGMVRKILNYSPKSNRHTLFLIYFHYGILLHAPECNFFTLKKIIEIT